MSIHDDYFGVDRDGLTLVRIKRAWLPEWAWRIATHLDRRARWLTQWLSEPILDEGYRRR